MKQRIFAILLSLTMMFTLVPTALAENNGITTEAELRAAIENATGEKKTITLAEDIGLASTLEIPADKHIEIQGDGHSIYRAESWTNSIPATPANILDIKGSLTSHNLTVDAKCSDEVSGFRTVSVSGSFEIYDTTIQNGNTLPNGGGANVLLAAEGSSFVMNSGLIQNGRGKNSGGVFAYGEGKGCTFTMSGGEISNNIGTWYGSGVILYNGTSKGYFTGGKIINNTTERVLTPDSNTGSYTYDDKWGGALWVNAPDSAYISGELEMYGNKAVYTYSDNSTETENEFDIFCTASRDGASSPIILSELQNTLRICTPQGPSDEQKYSLVRGTTDYQLTYDDLAKLELKKLDVSDPGQVFYLDKTDNTVKIANAVKVTLCSNNGTEDSITQNVPEGKDILLKANPFTKPGYIFVGWNATQDGTGFSYKLDSKHQFTENKTLYAEWIQDAGFCGAEGNEENVTWKLTANKEDTSTYTLTISGTGDMANLVTLNENLQVGSNNQPWVSAAHQITKLVIDEGITSIGDGAFYDTPKLKSAEIPASVTKIGVRAFNWAETMDSLTFAKESKLKEIGYAAFNKIAISEVTIPASVEKIDKQAFGNDGSLTTVLFEQDSALKEIEENAFFKCGKLAKLTLPEGLTTIGNRAFNNENTNLAAVVIPSTVTNFGAEIYNTQNGCLYFANSEAYNRYTKPQTMTCFMAVMNGGMFAPDTAFTTETLSEPSKDGYIFNGWYESANFSGNAVTAAPTAGHTYYAKWDEKADKTAPTAPTLKDRTYSSITLNTIEGAQYRCNGGAWQTSPEFTGLTAGTAYTFEAYYPETDTYKASPASEKAEFSTLYRSSGGSSSSGSSYAVSAPSAKNGDVTVSPKNASKGDRVTVTVKPDSGYEVGSVTVLDSKGNELKLTDKGDGKYTFTMPGGKVEVKATFVKAGETSPFVDVPADSYYFDAVKWAQKLGITNGKTDVLFGSSDPCTRGQIVTFLYRAKN